MMLFHVPAVAKTEAPFAVWSGGQVTNTNAFNSLGLPPPFTPGRGTVVSRAVPWGHPLAGVTVLRAHRSVPWRARVRVGVPSHEAVQGPRE